MFIPIAVAGGLLDGADLIDPGAKPAGGQTRPCLRGDANQCIQLRRQGLAGKLNQCPVPLARDQMPVGNQLIGVEAGIVAQAEYDG